METAVELAKRSPSAAVVMAWNAVERELFAACNRVGIAVGPRPQIRALIRELAHRKYVDPAQEIVFGKLRATRNLAAHSQLTPDDFSTKNAVGCGSIALVAVDFLRNIKPSDSSAS